MDYQTIIDRYYPLGSKSRGIYMRHSRDVADLALQIARDRGLALDPGEIEAAAMLHDIGICLTDAPSLDCHGTAHYLTHGVAGAKLLRSLSVDEKYARVAERHTGAGLTRKEIEKSGLPIPPADYLPESELERLVCYADKFYSKSGSMQRKPLERVRASMDKFGPDTRARFEKLHAEFSAVGHAQDHATD